MQDLGKRIRQARALQAWTQTEFAKRIGVHRSAAAQWEQRDGTMPSVENLIRIAKATGVQFEWLATGRGPQRVDTAASDSGVVLDEYAQDAVESRLLVAFRRLQGRAREPLVTLIESLSKQARAGR